MAEGRLLVARVDLELEQCCPTSGYGILIKLTAAHEPSGDIGRLQFAA